ncbi:MAG: PatB family C-S lyase [Anaerolineae bacterium]|nr:PatB family C-S lyase [Anaerolineae bacterium]
MNLTPTYNLNQPIDRHNTDSSKWRRYGDDVLPLWVADMDFISPRPVVEALHRRVEHGVFGYGDTPAALRLLICERLERLYGWKVSPPELFFLPGLVSGLNLVCRAVGILGDGVLMQTPVYPPFLTAPINGGRTVITTLLQERNGRYEVDFDAFEQAITPNTSLFLLCNPHNPVGRVYERWELERMAEICLRHDVLICADEIHCDLIYNGHRHIPMASLSPEVAGRCITLMSPSKTFNLAGLGCAFAVAQNPEIMKRVQSAAAGIVPHVNVLGYVAALAAYREGQSWLDEVLAYLTANRDYLVDFIQEHLSAIATTKPEGTYLAWLDCRNAGIPGNPFRFFLDQAKVALDDGARFGPGGEGFVRLNFGCPRATLAQALARMREAVEHDR